MSNLSSALATALQNDNAIGSLISGTISGRNFDLQDSLLATSPYACISVIDLPTIEVPYLGAANGKVHGQLEVRVTGKSSEVATKTVMDAIKAKLRPLSELAWNSAYIAFGITGWNQVPDISEDLSTWVEILTIDYISVA